MSKLKWQLVKFHSLLLPAKVITISNQTWIIVYLAQYVNPVQDIYYKNLSKSAECKKSTEISSDFSIKTFQQKKVIKTDSLIM